MGLIGSAGRTVAKRSTWLAKRLWIISLAEVAWLARNHWVRLEPDERKRLTELVRKARGRPSQLSDRERRDLEQLLDKLGHLELARDALARLIPLGGSLVRRIPVRRLFQRQPDYESSSPEPPAIARTSSTDSSTPESTASVKSS